MRLDNIQLNWTRAGFGYHWNGTVDLSFSPYYPAGRTLILNLNGSSITGRHTTSQDVVGISNIPISGDSVACQFNTNPSQLVVFDSCGAPTQAIAIINFTWRSGTC